MAKLFLTPIDLNKLELLNPTFQLLASAPGTPAEAQFYYDTTNDTVRFYNGSSAWESLVGNISTLTTISGAVVPADDYLAVWDASASANVKVTVANLLSDSLTGVYELPLTFQNGLTRTGNTVELGGTLINGATYITTGANIFGVRGDAVASVPQASITINNQTNEFVSITRSNASNNTIIPALRVAQNMTSGSGQNGLGVAIDLRARAGAQNKDAGRLAAVWYDAFNQHSEMQFHVATAGADPIVKMVLNNTGSLQLNSYGSGTFTGTPTYITAVSSTGQLIESNIGGSVSAFTDAGAFGSGDKLLIYDTSAAALRKIDYDDLPGASGTVGYTTITGDTGSASATGAETLSVVGGVGILSTVAAGTPDSLTIDLDFSGAQLTEGTTLETGDRFAIYDASATAMRYITYDNVLTELEADLNLSNYTFENGLTETGGTVKLGGTLTADTNIDAGATSTLRVFGSDAASILIIDNISGNGVGIEASATGTGPAVRSTSTNSGGIGVFAQNTGGGFALQATTTNASGGEAAIIAGVSGLTSSVYPALRLEHSSSGTAAAGFGVGINLNAESGSGITRNFGAINAVYTTVTNAAEVSKLQFQTMNAGTLATKVEIEGNGQLDLSTYGVGTHTGTAAKWLAVTAAGLVIEENAPAFAADAYSSFAGDTGGVISATGEEQINFVGGVGIETTSASGSPDSLTIDIDVDSEVNFTTTADWTFNNTVTGKGLHITGPIVDGSHAVNKDYVDMLALGLSGKASVRVATTVAGTLATSFEDGDTIDGITLATGDRILIKNQAAPAENGIYIVQASGAPVRAEDFNSWEEVVSAYVWVEVGTTLADTGWLCTSDQGGTLDTTAIEWIQFTGAYQVIAGEGLTKTGNTIDLDINDLTDLSAVAALNDYVAIYDTSASNTKKVSVANLLASGKYAETVDVGTSEGAVGITHNLGSTDVIVQVYDNTSKAVVELDVVITNSTTVTIQGYGSTRSVRVVVLS
jgi:hypothetical protein